MVRIRIMVFGTFDFLHKGHVHFFKQAKKLAKNSYLIVSVARASNVKKIKKRFPMQNTEQRLTSVKKCPVVDKVVLGAKADYISHIVKYHPSVIALGYDQTSYTQNLAKRLGQAGLKVKIVRLKPYKPHVYKSSLVKQRRLK